MVFDFCQELLAVYFFARFLLLDLPELVGARDLTGLDTGSIRKPNLKDK
jgi:hypothetical protein